MMLNMSTNNFDDVYHCGVGGTRVNRIAMQAPSTSSSLSTASSLPTLSARHIEKVDVTGTIQTKSNTKAELESIHSGQFMVSHFEAEEAQDDLLDDDGEIKMLDPEDPSHSKPDEPNPCMEVQLYVPRKVQKLLTCNSATTGCITSHLEIETSLSKLFKCMKLAYSQKLTSPKWNHFKGVRLRWKDKIRLNNVIWRCWHMQFILKRRTPVCQFASPLDVDVHSNPQSVVLEGKYWKRQLAVIKAEYRKWRKNYKSKATGCLTYDSKSEFDFLEWSPSNDRNLMLSEDWTSDTLFSAINEPFPFPDPREIARGAGIADFIQPSLGPLQPNLDDIDITFAELLQNPRLPTVPEEGSDEMLKNVDYGFSAIMGSEQMDSSSIMDMVTTAANNMNRLEQNNNDDTNMLELNTPINSMQFGDIEQQFEARQHENIGFQTATNASGPTDTDTMMTDHPSSNVLMPERGNRCQLKAFSCNSSDPGSSVGGRQSCNDFSGKSVIKGRISKNFQRPFRREPHNYDKAQPTLHQTTMYQQMLAEQQKNQNNHQQHLQANISPGSLHHQTTTYQHQSQTQPQQQQPQTMQYPMQQHFPVMGNNNNYGFNRSTTTAVGPAQGTVSGTGSACLNNNLLNMSEAITSPKRYEIVQNITNMPVTTTSPNSTQQMIHSVKIEPPSSDVLSMFNLTAMHDVFNNLKPYQNSPANIKKSASTGAYINMRDATGVQQAFMQDQSQPVAAQMHAQSLPLCLGGNPNQMGLNALQRHGHTQLSSTVSQQQQQQQQHHHHQHHQQQQQRQQSNSQSQQMQQGMMPKEMFRSNSLPLNVTLQKLDTRAGGHDTFAVPKFHAKTGKARSRSNSIHHHTPAASMMPSNSMSGHHSAISDPVLSSPVAQLLANYSQGTSSSSKQHSSSTSAISIINIPMSTGAIAMTTQKKPHTVTLASSNIFVPSTQQQQQPSPSSTALVGTMTTSSASGSELFHCPQGDLQQQQHKSPKKSTSLPPPKSTHVLPSPSNNKMLSYPLTGSQAASTSHLSLSPESFHDQDSPLSPSHSLKYPRENQRRAGHIHAEQKRRYNIKSGFDLMHALIPQLQQNPNAKLSKAAMLQKGAEHIKHLRSERNLLKDKMEALLKERDALNNSLTHLHSILPANGAPVTRQGTENVRQLYEQYVRYRTMSDWKFWILGLILEPLLTSYTTSVSSASMEELRRTAFLWVDQHCSLIDLRPAVSNKLKYLSMRTDILSDPPSTLQDEVAKAINNTTGQHPNLHGT